MLEAVKRYFSSPWCSLTLVAIFCCDHVASDRILPEVLQHPNWPLLDQGTICGRNAKFRIIGGEEAAMGEYPWIVRLGYSYGLDIDDDTPLFQCGGALISSRYVLSAAHCAPETVGRPLVSARLGEHDGRTNPDCKGPVCAPPVVDVPVEDYVCHAGFNSQVLQNDICLIRLSKDVPFKNSRYISTICLPVYESFRNRDYGKSMLEVAGWGVVDMYTMRTSDVLMKLKIPIKNNAMCAQKYDGKAKIISKQLCAGGQIGKDSCVGDSGGPLMKVEAVGGRPRYFVVGIVSFGPKYCAESDTPGVYTNVVDYLPWILDNVRGSGGSTVGAIEAGKK